MPSVTATNVLNNVGYEPAKDYVQTYLVLIIPQINPERLVRIVLFIFPKHCYVCLHRTPARYTMSSSPVHWYRLMLVNTTFIRSVLYHEDVASDPFTLHGHEKNIWYILTLCYWNVGLISHDDMAMCCQDGYSESFWLSLMHSMTEMCIISYVTRQYMYHHRIRS